MVSNGLSVEGLKGQCLGQNSLSLNIVHQNFGVFFPSLNSGSLAHLNIMHVHFDLFHGAITNTLFPVCMGGT